ncbi:hypothetical protein [Halomonas sp. NO4]|uniref:hypothetical protein n=1 Tax=Halomonas sp. NO4 TaxID=2484813 RepID=UPI0013CFDDC5|nr:hypothetical protein [Halomonas sp. NO4]
MDALDAFATPGITPPAAFHALRRELHTAAGPERIAAHRAFQEAETLRQRAEYLFDAMVVHAGTGLGDWYCKLATRFHQLAEEAEADGHELLGAADDAAGVLS